MANVVLTIPAGGAGQSMAQESYTLALREARKRMMNGAFRTLHSAESATALLEQLRERVLLAENSSGRKRDEHLASLASVFDDLKKLLSDSSPYYRAVCRKDQSRPKEERIIVEDFADLARVKGTLALFARAIRGAPARDGRPAIPGLPSQNEVDARFLEILGENFTLYRSSADYMGRLVRSRLPEIGSEELMEEGASTELLIMRQFIKQFHNGVVFSEAGGELKGQPIRGKNHGASGAGADNLYSAALGKLCGERYGGDYNAMARGLTQQELEGLQTDKSCHLAKIAFLFGKGRFGRQKKTRAHLYLFAIAFEMDVPQVLREALSGGNAPAEEGSRWSDINQCLFFDFYMDNPVNKREKTDEGIIDGYGINWKNFAEVIYLYFIAKKDMPADLKLYKAIRMIMTCHESGNAEEYYRANAGREEYRNVVSGLTEYFRSSDYLRRLFEMKEESFALFVQWHYVCKQEKLAEGGRRAGGSPVLYAEEHRTAEKALAALRPSGNNGAYGSGVSYGILNSLEMHTVAGSGAIVMTQSNLPVNVSPGFMECVNRIMERFEIEPSRKKKKANESAVGDKKVITRAELMVQMANDIAAHPEKRPKGVARSMEEFYGFFCSNADFSATGVSRNGADALLQACGFREVNDKSIYDMLIIYAAYRECHEYVIRKVGRKNGGV